MNEPVLVAEANAAVSPVGQPWTVLGRATDLVWCGFGATVTWRDHRGRNKEKPEFALHLQCPFRVSLHRELILGSPDLYESADGGPLDLYAPAAGQTRFDVRQAALDFGEPPSRVKTAMVNDLGDLTIELESGLSLEAFIMTADRYEAWRILRFAEPEFNFGFPDV